MSENRTVEENKEIDFLNAREKLECALLAIRQASIDTDRDVSSEIYNTILETFDGYTNIGAPTK